MSRSMVVKSFVELAEALGYDDLPEHTDAPASTMPDASDTPERQPVDLADLLCELEAASANLASVARRDQEARSLALQDLEEYDRLTGEQREAEEALRRAQDVRREADKLAECAFAEEASAAASRVASIAARAEIAATEMIEERRREVERLVATLNLERLLAERRRQEEADKVKAAQAEQARRLCDALVEAKQTLDAGHVQEAKAMLGPLVKDNPDNADVASLLEIIARREFTVKVNMAEQALWAVRREHRHDSAKAVKLLEALDVDGLPDPLARQVFGAWADHCTHLCRQQNLTDPLRYAPDPGRGAVLARQTPDGPYLVVSALGMKGAWGTGEIVAPHVIRGARPLR